MEANHPQVLCTRPRRNHYFTVDSIVSLFFFVHAPNRQDRDSQRYFIGSGTNIAGRNFVKAEQPECSRRRGWRGGIRPCAEKQAGTTNPDTGGVGRVPSRRNREASTQRPTPSYRGSWAEGGLVAKHEKYCRQVSEQKVARLSFGEHAVGEKRRPYMMVEYSRSEHAM